MMRKLITLLTLSCLIISLFTVATSAKPDFEKKINIHVLDNRENTKAVAILYDEDGNMLHKSNLNTNNKSIMKIPYGKIKKSTGEINNYRIRVITEDGRISVYSFGDIDFANEELTAKITLPEKNGTIRRKTNLLTSVSSPTISTLDVTTTEGTLLRRWTSGYTNVKFTELHAVDGIKTRMQLSSSSEVGTQTALSFDGNNWTAQPGTSYSNACTVTAYTDWITNESWDIYNMHEVIWEEWVGEDSNNNLIYWYEKSVGNPTGSYTHVSPSESSSENNEPLQKVADGLFGTFIVIDGTVTSGSFTFSDRDQTYTGVNYLDLVDVSVRSVLSTSTKIEWEADMDKYSKYAAYDGSGGGWECPIHWTKE